MIAMNWTELMIALLAWFAISVAVALIASRIVSRGLAEAADNRGSSLATFYATHFIKDGHPRSPRERERRAFGVSLKHSSPNTITP
jgi:hypothetical protein